MENKVIGNNRIREIDFITNNLLDKLLNKS